jgi:ABC-type lipopolysaccharide export system ATPase subunit
VDPIAVEDLQKEPRELADTGIAFLITDHKVGQMLRVRDRASSSTRGSGSPRGRRGS